MGIIVLHAKDAYAYIRVFSKILLTKNQFSETPNLAACIVSSLTPYFLALRAAHSYQKENWCDDSTKFQHGQKILFSVLWVGMIAALILFTYKHLTKPVTKTSLTQKITSKNTLINFEPPLVFWDMQALTESRDDAIVVYSSPIHPCGWPIIYWVCGNGWNSIEDLTWLLFSDIAIPWCGVEPCSFCISFVMDLLVTAFMYILSWASRWKKWIFWLFFNVRIL